MACLTPPFEKPKKQVKITLNPILSLKSTFDR